MLVDLSAVDAYPERDCRKLAFKSFGTFAEEHRHLVLADSSAAIAVVAMIYPKPPDATPSSRP